MSEAFHPCLGYGHWRVPIDQSVHRHKNGLIGDMVPLRTDGVRTLCRVVGTGEEVVVVSNNIEPFEKVPFHPKRTKPSTSTRQRRVDPELAFLDLCLSGL